MIKLRTQLLIKMFYKLVSEKFLDTEIQDISTRIQVSKLKLDEIPI